MLKNNKQLLSFKLILTDIFCNIIHRTIALRGGSLAIAKIFRLKMEIFKKVVFRIYFTFTYVYEYFHMKMQIF